MSWLIQYLIGICASLGREFPHGGHLLPEQETVFFIQKFFMFGHFPPSGKLKIGVNLLA